MENGLLGTIAGIVSTLLILGIAMLIRTKNVSVEELEQSRDFVFGTTKMAREELLKIFEASDEIVDFINKNFHEGESFGRELMEYVEGLKEEKQVIDIVPEDKKK